MKSKTCKMKLYRWKKFTKGFKCLVTTPHGLTVGYFRGDQNIDEPDAKETSDSQDGKPLMCRIINTM